MSRTRKLILLVVGVVVGTLVAPIAAFSAASSSGSASGIATIAEGKRCKTVDAGMNVTSKTKVTATVVTNASGAIVQRVARFKDRDEFRVCLESPATRQIKVSWIAHNGAAVAKSSHLHDDRYYTKAQVDSLIDGISGGGYENVIVVAGAGGDFTSVTAAMDAIGTDPDYPAASSTNRYLVWVAPGVYENEDIDMQPYVDIEGSGQGVTVLRSVGGAGGISPNAATLVGADNAELRKLSVEIEAAEAGNWTHAIYTSTATVFREVTALSTGGARARGMMVDSGAAPVLIDVIVLANGASVSNLGLDLFGATASADGLFADASGGDTANAIFLNTATSEVKFENVTTRASDGTNETIGLKTNLSTATLEGYNSVVVGNSSSAFGLMCDDEGQTVRVLGSTIYTENTGSGIAAGVNGFDCNLEVRDAVIDAVASGGNAFGVVHVQADTGQQADVTLADVESRALSATASAYGVSLSSSGASPAGTFGRVTDLNTRATGGSTSLSSWGVRHSAAGEVQYRGMSIIAEGSANFLYGVQTSGDGTPRFDDVVVDAVGSAEATVFGVEFFTDSSTLSNAQVRAINTATGSSHDAVGIKANNASDVTFVDISAYAEAETNVWGADLTGAGTTLTRVDAEAVGAPGELVYGARCLGGTADIHQSVLRSTTANVAAYGYQSNDCASTVTGSELSGDTYGLYVIAFSDGIVNVVRSSYMAGATTVRTVNDGEAVIVGSQLDGGAATTSGANDVQECTAVTYNSGGSEAFQAGTSDPCP